MALAIGFCALTGATALADQGFLASGLGGYISLSAKALLWPGLLLRRLGCSYTALACVVLFTVAFRLGGALVSRLRTALAGLAIPAAALALGIGWGAFGWAYLFLLPIPAPVFSEYAWAGRAEDDHAFMEGFRTGYQRGMVDIVTIPGVAGPFAEGFSAGLRHGMREWQSLGVALGTDKNVYLKAGQAPSGTD